MILALGARAPRHPLTALSSPRCLVLSTMYCIPEGPRTSADQPSIGRLRKLLRSHRVLRDRSVRRACVFPPEALPVMRDGVITVRPDDVLQGLRGGSWGGGGAPLWRFRVAWPASSLQHRARRLATQSEARHTTSRTVSSEALRPNPDVIPRRRRRDLRAVTYQELLTVLWDRMDPTTLNRQGNDFGTQYRSG